MRLRVLPFSFTSGLFAGIHLALLTLILLFQNTPGRTISQLSRLLPGFEFSPIGALVGFGWLFLGGMGIGIVVSLLYNLLLGDVAGGVRPPRERAPKPERQPRKERTPREAKPEKLPKAARPEKPAQPRKQKTRTPMQTPGPKRHKTPYPGKVGAWKESYYGPAKYNVSA